MRRTTSDSSEPIGGFSNFDKNFGPRGRKNMMEEERDGEL